MLPGAAEAQQLVVSSSPDRSGSVALSGATLSGNRYVQLTGVTGATQVQFLLDGAHRRYESNPPYDFAGGTAEAPRAWDTTTAIDGAHTISPRITYPSSTATVSATFGVANKTITAAPAPTPTEPAPAPAPTTTTTTTTTKTLRVVGDAFTLDGQPFDMWGVRTASATQDQAQTDHLIAQLDAYKAHGVNTVTVFYMGSRGAYYNPWTRDGGSIDAGHQGRMEQIIKPANARGMVVVAGLFYQHAPFSFDNADAVRRAARTAAAKLKPYRNVIINIANEQNSHGWTDSASSTTSTRRRRSRRSWTRSTPSTPPASSAAAATTARTTAASG
jgi:hypothetical protein